MPAPVEDPIALFDAWLAEAEAAEPEEPTAMTLATVASDGRPSARMVLLKGVDSAGFVFYTNVESRKGIELDETGRAALVFHWKSLRRQVRIDGMAERVSDEEADAYFATRPRGSQIGAWASDQSRPMGGSFELQKAGGPVHRKVPASEPCPVRRTGPGTGFCRNRSNSGATAPSAFTSASSTGGTGRAGGR